LGVELDLVYLALQMSEAEYEPDSFPGLIFRTKNPKTATLLFRSGNLVCTGARSPEMANKPIETVIVHLKKSGIPITDSHKMEVQNIVAWADLGQPLNLNAITVSLGLERVEYGPEQFSGLVNRLTDQRSSS
jgi:transcription initiation factor TFIID TATA-box-binding protein